MTQAISMVGTRRASHRVARANRTAAAMDLTGRRFSESVNAAFS